MTKTSVRKCPVCENCYAEVLHHQKFVLPEGHPLSGGYDVVCDHRCGFVYADIVPNQRSYDSFYAAWSKYEDKKTATGMGTIFWDLRRLEDTAKYLMEVWPDRDMHIVDIGCANGGLLHQLKKAGYGNLCGVDPSPNCVENVKAFNILAFTGTLFSLPEEAGLFDGVILSHVLEHIIDLKGAMHSVDKRMKAGGQVYLELPDASRYADHVFSPYQEFNAEHINHFSDVGCANLMRSKGFKLMAMGKKLIESSPDMPYPVIYSVWTKDPVSGQERILEKDNVLKSSIENYLRISQRMMRDIDKKLDEILPHSPRLILWGTGQLLIKLLADTALGEAGIVAFVDGNPINQGKTIRDIPILAPEEIRHFDAPILITSLLHRQAISDAIRRLNMPNDILFLL